MKLVKPVIVALAVNLAACASPEIETPVAPIIKVAVADCVFPNQQPAPNWVCDEPIPGLDVQAVGIAERSDAGFAYMKDMAKSAAFGHLAEQFKVKVAKMVKKYMATTGMGDDQTVDAATSSTLKTITSKTLEGAKVYKTRTGPEGRLYVLVGFDVEKTAKLVKAAVKNSMKNDKALWQEFKAKKSHDELAAGIAAMED